MNIKTGIQNMITYNYDSLKDRYALAIETDNFEYFKIASSNDVINVVQTVSEKCYVNYFKKILSLTNKIILDSIIIIGNDKGEIKILINIK